MFVAQFEYPAIPQAGKPARRLGVPNVPRRHSEALKRAIRQAFDDLGDGCAAHGATVPKSLALVKPSDAPSHQKTWPDMLPGMDLADKPFGDIADRLRWHRALEGVDQKTYAEKAGLKRAQLSNWESGDYRLSLDGARALRKTYGLSLDFIYEGIDDALPMTLRMAWRDRS